MISILIYYWHLAPYPLPPTLLRVPMMESLGRTLLAAYGEHMATACRLCLRAQLHI